METILLFAFMFVLPALGALLGGSGITYKHLRGTKLTPLWEVHKRLRRWQDDPNTLVWGRFRVPLSVAKQHFLLVGTTRSGKTVLLRLLMQSAFPRIGQGESHRALIYDGKAELLNIVLGLKQSYQQVITFDPVDSEGLRYDIAADVTDDATANQVASLLFPKYDGEHQPFFSESVQNLSAAIMQVFNEIAPGQWRLSHLLFVMRSADRMIAVLSATTRGRDIVQQFQHSGETWGNITATISNRIRDYEIVAALHDHAAQSFSMKEWNETESILVLQKSPFCPEVMDALNRVLFTLAKRRLLTKPPSPKRRTWIIFDELASIKSKEIAKELGLLLEQGASRNISVALAFQNFPSLRDEFGPHGADRLVALCGTKALLRLEDYSSAETAAGLLGKQEVRVKSVSSTDSSGGGGHSSGTTTSYQDQVRWVVEPSEFQAIAPPGNGVGITGFFGLPLQESTLYKDTIPAKWVFDGKTLAPEYDRVVVERPASAQQLQITEADIEQLLKGQVQLGGQSATTSGAGGMGIATSSASPATVVPSAPPPPGQSTTPNPTSGQSAANPNSVGGGIAANAVNGNGVAPLPSPSLSGIPQSAPVQAQAPQQTSGASPAIHQAATPPPATPPGPNTQSHTSTPQIWDLSNGTVLPASIWSVVRPT